MTSITWPAVISPEFGGTGVSATPGSGDILIGTGSSYVLNTISAGSNITINSGAGSVTLNAWRGTYAMQQINAATINSLQNLVMNGGTVISGSGSCTLGTSSQSAFTLGVGTWSVTASINAESGSSGWIKTAITDINGNNLGSPNVNGFTQNVGTGAATDWSTNMAATALITVSSGTTNVYLRIWAESGSVNIGSGIGGSTIHIQQVA